MAGSVNRVILIGNLGKDPEIRSMQSGDKVASFSIATSESWKEKTSGERKEKTEWHRISVFNQGLINVIERYVKKGSKVYIDGQLETRRWTDKDGVEKYSTEVILRPFRGELTMLDNKGSSDGQVREEERPYGSLPPEKKPATSVPENYDDDIPFAPVGTFA